MNGRKRKLSYIILVLFYLVPPLFTNAWQLHAQGNDTSNKQIFIKVYPLQFAANKQFLFGFEYQYTNKETIEIQIGPFLMDYYYRDLMYSYSFLPAVGGSLHLNHRYKLSSKKISESFLYINNQVFAKYVKLKDFRDYKEDSEGGFDSLYQLKYVMGYKLLIGMKFPLYGRFYLDINTGIGLRYRRTNNVRFYRKIWQDELERFYVDDSNKQTIDDWFGLTPHFQLGLGYKVQ